MDREIKFRGMNIGGFWIHSDKVGLCAFFDFLEHRNSAPILRPNTVGQFTGLKDKNGKEIYEGDIVAKGHWRYGLNPHNTLIGLVIYEAPFFCLHETFIPKAPEDGCSGCAMEINPDLAYYISNRGENILEVIGNVYESPALLAARTQRGEKNG